MRTNVHRGLANSKVLVGQVRGHALCNSNAPANAPPVQLSPLTGAPASIWSTIPRKNLLNKVIVGRVRGKHCIIQTRQLMPHHATKSANRCPNSIRSTICTRTSSTTKSTSEPSQGEALYNSNAPTSPPPVQLSQPTGAPTPFEHHIQEPPQQSNSEPSRGEALTNLKRAN